MQIFSKFKFVFAICLIFILTACNSNSKYKIELKDIKQEEKHVEPPPPPPPKDSLSPIMEIKGGKTKCFVSGGLKYRTTVTLGFNDKEAMGIVSSEELESGKKRSTAFAGTRNGNEFTVSFKRGDPPVIGEASEWTNKPWALKKEGANETLHIIFNAKNYNTNKWEDTDYLFAQVECK